MCCLVIRYLVTGELFRSPEFQFRISRVTILKLVIEACQALYEAIGPKYLATPKSQEGWLKLSEKFEAQWNFANHKIQAHIIIIIKICSYYDHGIKFFIWTNLSEFLYLIKCASF